MWSLNYNFYRVANALGSLAGRLEGGIEGPEVHREVCAGKVVPD